ncbi:unnamed protein product [Bursaphelenchus xylophilus]|uniref:(pine wood nematode) hypothetical protein n=1 Tax=Bursaphelenchus xylophilus TaxID=6326 RepID=A0A1I7STL9_BURXY|nr:unnamed protein product [Bursaphelenchus xylophilus]CAG9108240.1 unnamed protein product [Bursaphelenchus xylophilus]
MSDDEFEGSSQSGSETGSSSELEKSADEADMDESEIDMSRNKTDDEDSVPVLPEKKKRLVDTLREKALLKNASKPKLEAAADFIDLADETAKVPCKMDVILNHTVSTPKSQPRRNWACMKAEFSKKLAEDRRRGLIERRKQFNEDNELWEDEEEEEFDIDDEEEVRVESNPEEKAESPKAEKDGDSDKEEYNADEEGSDQGENDGDVSDDERPFDDQAENNSRDNEELDEEEEDDLTVSDDSQVNEKRKEVVEDIVRDGGLIDWSGDYNHPMGSQEATFFVDDGVNKELLKSIASDDLVREIVFGELLNVLSDAEIFEIETELVGFKTDGPSIYDRIMEKFEEENVPKRSRKRRLEEIYSDEEEISENKKANFDDDLFQVEDNEEIIETSQATRVQLDDDEAFKARTAVDNLRWENESDVFEAEDAVESPRKKRDLLEDEAELSGSDVGSDVDDEEDIGDYMAEEGDNDKLDMDEVRGQNMKTYMKLRRDEDDRFVEKIQEEFDVRKEDQWDRSFRQRLRDYDQIELNDLFKGEDQDENETDDPVVSVKALDAVVKRVREGVGESFERNELPQLILGKGDKSSASLRARNSLLNRE